MQRTSCFDESDGNRHIWEYRIPTAFVCVMNDDGIPKKMHLTLAWPKSLLILAILTG